MKKKSIRFLIVFVVAVSALLITLQWCLVITERNDATDMRSAAALTARWYSIIGEEKHRRGIVTDAQVTTPYASMIGDEYSEITTTLGSIEAKTAAADPEFSALMVRLLHDGGIHSGSSVGITLSGSFPSLSIATLAALQTIGANVTLISSLGSSSYGANQPLATWIDMEQWLRERGGLKYQSTLVTYGAEGDSGAGISDEGKKIIMDAVTRNKTFLFIPRAYEEAIEKRINLFQEAKITLLVNIGGNQTSMGYCAHSTTIPNGYHKGIQSCMEPGRGLIVRMVESGVPFIHLINIRDLAVKNGLPLIPDGDETSSLYTTRKVKQIPVVIMLIGLLVLIVFLRKVE